MSTPRRFPSSLATLTSSADLLKDALADPDYATQMTLRLGEDFITDYPGLIIAVTGGQAAQNSQIGDISQLTDEQQEDFTEMKRLASGARETAKLAFPGQDTILRAEFQVGINQPQGIGSVIARSRLIHTAAVKYATQLQAKGWIPSDTVALDTAINGLSEIASDQDEAGDDRLDLTDDKVKAANTLYAAALTIQNAANIQYPGGYDSSGNARNLTARARFLMDSFPPRNRPDPGAPPAPPVP